MVDPEPPDRTVRMGEGQPVGRHRVGEAGGVEVQAQPQTAGPGHPALEMTGVHRVPAQRRGVGLAVDGVEVHPVPPGDHRQRALQVGTQLGRRPGPPGMGAGDRQSAARRSRPVAFEALHVVALPALERDGDAGQRRQGRLGVDARGQVTAPGHAIGPGHRPRSGASGRGDAGRAGLRRWGHGRKPTRQGRTTEVPAWNLAWNPPRGEGFRCGLRARRSAGI